METIIGIKQLYRNMSRIARRVRRGERVLVMKHRTPMFLLTPYEEKTNVAHAFKYSLEDLKKLKAKGGSRTISREIDKIVYGL